MDPYILRQSNYEKYQHAFYETIFVLSNGYVGLRSTVEFDSEYSLPGAFFYNLYDYGMSVPNHLVNGPNWLDIKISVEDEIINFDFCQIQKFERILDMKQAMVSVYIRFKDSNERITALSYSYYIHAKKNISVITGKITAINYNGKIKMDMAFNYSSGNSYHGGYYGHDVKSFQLELCDHSHEEDICNVSFMTKGSKKTIHMASSVKSTQATSFIPYIGNKRLGTTILFDAQEREEISFTKYVTFDSNSNDARAVNISLQNILCMDEKEIFNEHKLIWKKRWSDISFSLDGDFKSYQGMIFGTFQLLQVMNDLEEFNVPARGLSSEYHGGHFFFNSELYKVPFYSWHYPSRAKAMLMYRVRTKETALEHAKNTGYKGVRWSEESGPNGEPAGPTRIYNFAEGTWSEEKTGRLVIHIGSNVTYSMLQYALISGDDLFLYENLDLLLEISRFYASAVEWDVDNNVYCINHVIGPDEYHIGVNNNLYTNYFAQWCIKQVLILIKSSPNSLSDLDITSEEISYWEHIVANIKIPQKNELGIYEQFDGYFQLADKKVMSFDENNRPVLDQELYEKTRNFSGDGTKIIKQCDVIMLMSMLRNDFGTHIKAANFNYYDPRTMHESSLSATHAGIVAADVGEIDLAYQYYLFSSRYNLDFFPKENYNNGLHIAAFAGAWLIYLYGFFGIDYDAFSLKVKPNLPSTWNFTATNIIWKNYRIRLEATRTTVSITMIGGPSSIQIVSNGVKQYLSQDERLEFEVDDFGITLYSSE